LLFKFKITTPANTPATSKQKTTLPLLQGKIIQTTVLFPPGPSGLLHLQIYRGSRQVVPLNDGEDIRGNNVTFIFPEELLLLAEPYELIAYTWNESTQYEHEVDIYITLSRSGVFIE